MQFSPTNIVGVASFEMLLYTLTGVPVNTSNITDLGVLLGMTLIPCDIILFNTGSENLAGLLINNIIYTIDPSLLSDYCSILLSISPVFS